MSLPFPTLDSRLQEIVTARDRRGLLRRVDPTPSDEIDFSSNDYLGLARNKTLNNQFLHALAQHASQTSKSHSPSPNPLLGSTGSRLLNGDSSLAHSLEAFLSRFHSSKSALLFNSGYDANLSLFSTLPQPGDLVLIDELVHASVHDGVRICRAKKVERWRHNDVQGLEKRIRQWYSEPNNSGSNVIVGVEACYSMDGDVAPLMEIVKCLGEFGGRAVLVVDEVCERELVHQIYEFIETQRSFTHCALV